MKQKIFLSLFFIPIILLGIALGIWQSYRSAWKQTLLQEYHATLLQKPTLLPTVVIHLRGEHDSVTGKNSELFKPFELMPITLTGHFVSDLIFYRPADEGLELITAFETTDGIIAINAGKIPYAAKDTPISDILPTKEITLTGFYRIAEIYGGILPKNKSLVSKIPYASYLKTYKDKTLAGAIHVDDTTKISPYLKGRAADYFIKNIPNNHTQYMYTWFLLAGVAFIIYVILLKKTRHLTNE